MGWIAASIFIIGVTAAVRAWGRLSAWRDIRAVRFRQPDVRAPASERIRPALEPLFELAESDLGEVGFEPAATLRYRSALASERPGTARLLFHAGTGTYALVRPSTHGPGERPYQVCFTTEYDDSVIASIGQRTVLGLPAPSGWRVQEWPAGDPGALWHAHRSRLGEGAVGRRLSVREFVKREHAALSDQARVLGLVDVAGSSPGYRLGPAQAWWLSRSVLLARRRQIALEHQRAAAVAREAAGRGPLELWSDSTVERQDRPELLRAARAAADAWHLEDPARDAAPVDPDPEAWLRRAGIAIGLLGTCAVVGWSLSWRIAAVVLGVVTLHEAGHRAARAILAHREDPASAQAGGWREGLVGLLGPLPGLIMGLMGLVLYLDSGRAIWLEIGVTAFTFNYVTLLPITPLDGGRIVDVLILGRFPHAQVALLLAGGGLLGLAAVHFKDAGLAAVALAVVIAIPARWRIAVALHRAARLDRERDSGAQPSARELLDVLQEPPFARMPAPQRELVGRRILAHARARRPSTAAAVAGGAVYLLLLVTPPVVASRAGIPAPEPRTRGIVAEHAGIDPEPADRPAEEVSTASFGGGME